jgi:inactivated superfamily I helicase/RecB family exonuclease
MSCKVIIAPPASGKTHYCLVRVFQCLERTPLIPAWIVAPDNLQVADLRRRVARRGGALGLNIGTFGDLYQLILRRAGISLPVMSELMGLRLTGGVIQTAGEKGELKYFGPIRDTPGLRAALHERFKELERALVEPGEMNALPESQRGSLEELARLYGAYHDRLRQLGWMDSAGMNRRACQALQEDPALVSDIPILVLDGFDSFNPSQIRAIGLLAAAIPEVLVTLAGSEGWDRLPHRRFKRTLDSLVQGVSCSIDYYAWHPRLPADLAHLERNLFETDTGTMDASTGVEMISVRSPAAEARESLRWLKARIRRDEYHLDHCAIVCPDLERYRPYLREVAQEYGIPLRFSRGYPLRRAPSVHALRNLLALPLSNWPRRALLSVIRSPYFDLSSFDLEAGDSAALEDVSLHGQVIEGLDQWMGILSQLASRPAGPDAAEDEELRLPNLPRGAQADELLRGLAAMGERLSVLGRRTAEAWVRWLEDLLEELRFFDLQREPQEKAAGLTLRETLRGLVISEGVLGSRKISAGQFVTDLESVLDAAALEIPMDWRMPAVRVLGVLEARGARFDALAVLGLSEGLFPEVEREDPFLGEDVRARLGLDARLGRAQAGLFYQILTRADRSLLLTRPYLADDGERWAASPFWRAAAAIWNHAERRLSGEFPRPLNDAGSPGELLFWAARAGGLPGAFKGAFRAEWEALIAAQEILQARLSASPAGPYEGGAAGIRDVLERRYGAQHVWSASQLETYGTCPFMFYASSALGLEGREPPEPGIDPAQLGALLHAILESTYAQAEDTADVDEILRSLEAVAGAEFAAAPERYGFRPNALWEVEKEQLLETLRETVRSLEALGEGWIPTAFEAVFGIRGNPPLELEHDGQTYRLGGIIDRVDRRGASQIRVIDYKTGSRHLSYQDLVDGRRLQLPLYALAARDALDLGEPVEGFYWLIMQSAPSSLRLARFRLRREGEQPVGPEAAMRVSIQHLADYVSATQRGEFPPEPPDDGCPDYCPAAAWCWRYNPGW